LRYVEVRFASPARGDRSRAWNWWSDASRGGGTWGAVGSHSIDAIRYFGHEITAVQALLVTIVDERSDGETMQKVTADDFAAVHLRLDDHAVAAMTFSFVAGGPDEPIVTILHGEQGALRLIGEELLHARRNEPWSRVAGDELAKRNGNSNGGA